MLGSRPVASGERAGWACAPTNGLCSPSPMPLPMPHTRVPLSVPHHRNLVPLTKKILPLGPARLKISLVYQVFRNISNKQ